MTDKRSKKEGQDETEEEVGGVREELLQQERRGGMERESERKSEGKGIREGSYREKGCVCVCVCVFALLTRLMNT